jgi:flagellar assembly protein FliH
MSTSPKQAPSGPPAGDRSRPWQPYSYDPATGDGSSGQEIADAAVEHETTKVRSSEADLRAQGRAEGQAAVRQEFEARLGEERSRIGEAVAEFKLNRSTYFQKVETEVVQLALSIARKVLHREAQVDPLVLAGIVHVALQRIDGATSVVLRIHPKNMAAWRHYLSARLRPENFPTIVEDESRPLDRCSLETDLGTTQIGLELQLKEIEQGLMDLLSARPGEES